MVKKIITIPEFEKENFLIISREDYFYTKSIIKNINYNYLICNNTLFDKDDSILFSNEIDIDSEKILALASIKGEEKQIFFKDSMDNISLSNFVKIIVKKDIFGISNYCIENLIKNPQLNYKNRKGYIEFYQKDGLEKILKYLIANNLYQHDEKNEKIKKIYK